jgi:hypothetical protein
MRNVLFVSILITALFIQCSKNPASASAVASEAWKISEDGTQNYANITLSKLSNGAFSTQGSWYYTFFGYKITCVITSGSATIKDSSVNIMASGIASYPPDSTGTIDSSSFNLQMLGIFKAGSSQGTWQITFTDTTWNGWIKPGQFTGQRQSGEGVTE